MTCNFKLAPICLPFSEGRLSLDPRLPAGAAVASSLAVEVLNTAPGLVGVGRDYIAWDCVQEPRC